MAESMQNIMHPGAKNEANRGFPYAPADWTPADGESTAREEGVTLADDHWAAIQALQEYFSKHTEPNVHVRKLHDALEEKFHGSGGLTHLYQLFPGGPVAQGCRIAGLKQPVGSKDESFGSVQ